MQAIFKGNRSVTVLVLLVGILAVCMLVAVALGSVSIPILDVAKMSLNKTGIFDFDQSWRSAHETIIFRVRLPLVVGGVLVGAALSTAGVLFQGLLRNPMADPYIIGTSAGAAFGAYADANSRRRLSAFLQQGGNLRNGGFGHSDRCRATIHFLVPFLSFSDG